MADDLRRTGACQVTAPALASLLLALSAGHLAGQEPAACRAEPGAPRLDHAIVVVRDLDSAAARFRPLGFRFKPGRLHPDSLLNLHIKFRDRTEVELMTLAGRPTSRMARGYAELLATGEKGVYVALWTDGLDPVNASAERMGLPTRATTLGAWQFLSFPGVGDAAAIFFGAGGLPPNDPDSILAHENGAVSLAAAWIEAGPVVDELLTRLGSRVCEPVALPDGRTGRRWTLAAGSLVIVRPAASTTTPRVLGVELSRAAGRYGPPPSPREPLPGFWVILR
jgi:hypothetical protein